MKDNYIILRSINNSKKYNIADDNNDKKRKILYPKIRSDWMNLKFLNIILLIIKYNDNIIEFVKN